MVYEWQRATAYEVPTFGWSHAADNPCVWSVKQNMIFLGLS